MPFFRDRKVHEDVWKFALPLLFSNLSVPLVGMVDTMMMGQSKNPALIGGVALGTSLFSFLFWGFGFLKQSTTALCAQAHGKGSQKELQETLAKYFFLAFAIGSSIVLLQKPILFFAMTLFQASTEVENNAAIYFSIRVWSAPFVLLNYIFLGWFLGTQRSSWVLLLQLLLNFSNVAMSYFFVFVLKKGIDGVALASVLASIVTCATSFVLQRKSLHFVRLIFQQSFFRGWENWKQLFQMNLNIMLRTLSLLLTFAIFTNEGSKQGNLVLAANTILFNFQIMFSSLINSFEHAVQVFVGNYMGNGDIPKAKQYIIISTFWAFVFAVLASLTFFSFGNNLLPLFSKSEQVIQTAKEYWIWIVLLPLVSVWSFQMDGIFLGMLETKALRNGMIASTLLFIGLLAPFVSLWGNHGLWLAFFLFMISRTAMLSPTLYQRMKST